MSAVMKNNTNSMDEASHSEASNNTPHGHEAIEKINAPIGGCRWCGRERANHPLNFVQGVGFHLFEAPGSKLSIRRAKAQRQRAEDIKAQKAKIDAMRQERKNAERQALRDMFKHPSRQAENL